MSTAVWIVLSVAGVVVGFLAGYGLKRRRETIAAGPAAGPAETPGRAAAGKEDAAGKADAAGKEDAAGVLVEAAFRSADDDSSASPSTNGDVIDLRRTAPDPSKASATPAGMVGVAEPTRAKTDDGVVSTRSRTTTDAPPTLEPGEQPHEATIIDVRDRVKTVVPVHNLQFVRGIGPALDLALRREGIVTLADLAHLDRPALDKLAERTDGLSAKAARKKLQPRARNMLDGAGDFNAADPPDTTALRTVSGIGTTMARWLETRDITSLEDLAALDSDQLDELDAALTDYPGRIRSQRWVNQARQLLARS